MINDINFYENQEKRSNNLKMKSMSNVRTIEKDRKIETRLVRKNLCQMKV